jgi:hypothetical protein
MEISDVSIHQVELKSSAFTILQSDFVMNSVSISNITEMSQGISRFLIIESSSTAVIQNAVFQNATVPFMNIADSSVEIHNTVLTNITTNQNIIEGYK